MKDVFVTGGSGFVGRNLIRALIARGAGVRALARSAGSRAVVEKLGARGVDGDLDGDGVDANIVAGMKGCDAVIHCGAATDDWGTAEAMWRANVGGTVRMLACAAAAGVPRFVHTSTEAVLIDGDPLVRVDETRPLPARPIGLYASTKGEAERRVLAANSDAMACVIVRPRFVWGNDDSTLLPKLIEENAAGRLLWMGGGMNLTSTTHVDNACHGLILAAEKGRGGEIYFVTDGEPIAFRSMVEAMLRAKGVTPGTKTIPKSVAHAAAVVGDFIARHLGLGRPPLPHLTFHLLADEVTVVDDKARRELGYTNAISREEGLVRMKTAF